MISFGSACSGIEAVSCALNPIGFGAAWFAEIEKFPSKVLAYHYPHVVNHGDMCGLAAKVHAGQIDAPDVLAGGTPCQAFSIAGLRNSMADARGQLTLSFVELANEIDSTRDFCGKPPCVILWENVPGVLSTADNAFGCFLGALAGEDSPLIAPGGKWANAGCVYGPQRNIAWRTLDAQYFGVAQRRRRVFVVASAREGFDPTTVLFEFDGVRRDTAPSREAGQDVTGTISSRTTGGGGLGTDFELGGGFSRSSANDVVCMAHGQGGAEIARERRTTLTCNHEAPIAVYSVALRGREGGATAELGDEIAGSLRCGGGGGDKAHVLAPIAFSCKDHGADAAQGTAPTMRAMNSTHSNQNAGGQLAFCQNTRDEVHLMNGDGQIVGALSAEPGMKQTCYVATCVTGDVTHTLKAEGFDASEDGTGRGQPIVTHAIQAGALRLNPASGPDGVGVQANVAYTLEARSEVQCAQMGMAVRRLTPAECERLQAFEDNYTLIPNKQISAKRVVSLQAQGRDDEMVCINGKWWSLAADGPRYKTLGNSMCVNNIRWIGQRIKRYLESCANQQ